METLDHRGVLFLLILTTMHAQRTGGGASKNKQQKISVRQNTETWIGHRAVSEGQKASKVTSYIIGFGVREKD